MSHVDAKTQQELNSKEQRYSVVKQQLATKIDSERIITDDAQRLAYGTDASFYRLIPQIVLRLKDLEEVVFAIQCCKEHNVPFTFRAAGTSLSGQAVSDSVLIALTDDWRGYTIINDGAQIKLQPGVIGADANKISTAFPTKNRARSSVDQYL